MKLIKIRKSLIAIFCSVCILLSTGSFQGWSLSGDDSSLGLSTEDLRIIEEQSEALNIGEYIKNNFSESEYGGMYIDDNNLLHVFLTSNDELENYLIGKNVVTHEANYTLEELNSAVNQIASSNINYESAYLDESSNRVKVEVKMDGKSRSAPNTVKCLSDIFEVIPVDDTVSVKNEAVYRVKPGSAATTSSGSFSIAFGAKDSAGNIGFVTAGHCVGVNGEVYSAAEGSGHKLGTCVKSYVNTNCDGAFIQRAKQIITFWKPVGLTAYSGNTLHGASSSFLIQGANCHLEGKTSKHQSGTITSLNHVFSDGDRRVTASYQSDSGDSGGCVWVGRYVDNIFFRYAIGVHNGSYSEGGARKGAYFTGIDKIYSSLGVTYYAET